MDNDSTNMEIAEDTVETVDTEKHGHTNNSRRRFRELPKDAQRFYNLLNTLFNVCTLAGFRIEGRVKIRDLKTGKIWE